MVENLNSSAINDFGDKTQAIFEIVGPEAAKFEETRQEYENKITKCYERQRKKINELAKSQGKIQILYKSQKNFWKINSLLI